MCNKLSSCRRLLHRLHVGSPKGGPHALPELFPQQPPPRDSIHIRFTSRPFPTTVISFISACNAISCTTVTHPHSGAVSTLTKVCNMLFARRCTLLCLFCLVSPSLKPKITSRVDYIFAFHAGRRVDQGAEPRSQQAQGNGPV